MVFLWSTQFSTCIGHKEHEDSVFVVAFSVLVPGHDSCKTLCCL